MVRAARDRVWARVVTAEGVSDEFGPLLTMRFPSRLAGSSIVDLPRGRSIGRAWILLGGVIPVEYDDLVVVDLVAPRYFRERSRLGSCRVWEHRRDERRHRPRGQTPMTGIHTGVRVSLVSRHGGEPREFR